MKVNTIDKKAAGVLLLRQVNVTLFMLIPIYLGTLAYLFTSVADIQDSNVYALAAIQQHTLLINYAKAIELSYVLLFSLLVTHRWATMIHNGTYGYWLSQGISRDNFFLHSFLKILMYIAVGLITSLIIIIYPGGVELTFAQQLGFLLINMGSAYVLLTLAVLTAEIVKNAEFATILYVFINWVNITGNTNSNSLLHIAFHSNYHFGADIWMALLLAVIIGTIFLISAIYLHRKEDVEL